MLYNPGRVSRHDRIWGYTSAYDGVCADDTILSNDEISAATYNCGTETDPTPFFDMNRSSGRNPLITYRDRDILECMIMVHDQCRWGKNDIAADVYEILG